MSFLNSLLNDLNDIEIQYQNESNLWSLYYLKNFNQRTCYCHEDDINQDSNCNCEYSLNGQFRILADDEIIKILYYLKTKNIIPNYSHLITDANGPTSCSWNSLMIDIFQLTDEKIEKMKTNNYNNRINVFAKNYNILSIMSGLGSISYSS